MPEHIPVPLEACRAARVDDQRRTVPMSCRGARRPFAFGPFLSLKLTRNGSRPLSFRLYGIPARVCGVQYSALSLWHWQLQLARRAHISLLLFAPTGPGPTEGWGWGWGW
jgi:hypothetical protein